MQTANVCIHNTVKYSSTDRNIIVVEVMRTKSVILCFSLRLTIFAALGARGRRPASRRCRPARRTRPARAGRRSRGRSTSPCVYAEASRDRPRLGPRTPGQLPGCSRLSAPWAPFAPRLTCQRDWISEARLVEGNQLSLMNRTGVGQNRLGCAL